LDSGKDNLPRNRTLVFRFSSPVNLGQDLPERLKIQNIQSGAGQSDFSRAIGLYFVSADVVVFVPRLPEKNDRSDAGFRANGNYHVFLKGGPDGLSSTTGDQIVNQQEFLFDTNDKFEDPDPTQPPRALMLLARDTVTGATQDISRLDPRPVQLGQLDSSELLAAVDSSGAPAPRAIEPGAGGAPNFSALWQLELYMSEPLDPETVNTDNIELFEVRGDALDGATTANPGTFGTVVNFRVPITVKVIQTYDSQGGLLIYIQITPIQTLVDDARYRLVVSGNILGIDFNKKFIGENGLTGSGDVPLSSLTQGGVGVFAEPGGLGYTSDFLVYDRPAITATRTVTYNPLIDGINPELGATTLDPTLFNGAQYNSPSAPGVALGVIGNFGQGDEDFAVSGGNTAELDTGDQPNELNNNPFTTDTGPGAGPDLDPTDTYKNTSGLPTPGFLTFDSLEATVFEYGTLTISSSSTLNVIGVNPCRIVCTGLVQINGTLSARGGDGGRGFSTGGGGPQVATTPGFAGTAGPGGWAGGQANSPQSGQSQFTTMGCGSFDVYLSATGVVKSKFPHSLKGEGPGRGNQGGEAYQLQQQQGHSDNTGTGGGGGSYATKGERGEDRFNNILKTSTTSTGQPGKCGRWGAPASSLIGLRGMPGPTYGDRELLDITSGGSGGGSGGGIHGWYNSGGGVASGGGGGGGGGFLEVISAGSIVVAGGTVTVAGGDGGKGAFQSLRNGAWTRVAGSGAGGSGGGLSLISTNGIDLAGAVIDARGGTGGPRPNNPPSVQTCNSCNAGGDGGKGFIHLMDPDGIIPALGVQGFAGNYDDFEFGVLSVRQFTPVRFGGIAAVTELFNVRAANPDYLAMADTDVVGNVNDGQEIVISLSSAKADVENPLIADLTTELLPAIEIARVKSAGGGSVVDITGDMTALNQFPTPDREAYLRVIADFDYDDPSQAALGPFASLDEVTATFTFNG